MDRNAIKISFVNDTAMWATTLAMETHATISAQVCVAMPAKPHPDGIINIDQK